MDLLQTSLSTFNLVGSPVNVPINSFNKQLKMENEFGSNIKDTVVKFTGLFNTPSEINPPTIKINKDFQKKPTKKSRPTPGTIAPDFDLPPRGQPGLPEPMPMPMPGPGGPGGQYPPGGRGRPPGRPGGPPDDSPGGGLDVKLIIISSVILVLIFIIITCGAYSRRRRQSYTNYDSNYPVNYVEPIVTQVHRVQRFALPNSGQIPEFTQVDFGGTIGFYQQPKLEQCSDNRCRNPPAAVATV